MAFAFTIGAEGKPAAKYIPELLPLLTDHSANLRKIGARAFFEMGRQSASLGLSALKKLLKDPDKEVREQAKNTIESFTRSGN